MPAMVLCPSCNRHVFAREAACPFCGLSISASAGHASAAPSPAPELSRAQRYLVGAAIVATVAVAGCNSKPARDPDQVNQEELQRQQQEELEQNREERHQGGGPCNPTCPPYGCVFPDEACDIVRV